MSTLAQVAQIARRSVLRTARQPANIIFPFVFPTALLAVTSAGLDPATEIPGFPSDSFMAFFLAFPFIQGALFATMNAGTDLARDIQSGFLNRLALTPMRGVALIAGQLAGIAALGFVQSLYYLAVGLIVGVRIEAGLTGAVVLIVLATAVAIAFGALGAFFAATDRIRRGGPGPLSAALRRSLPLLDEPAAESDRNRLVPDRRDVQPDLIPDRGPPQPDHRRLDWQALALAFGFAAALAIGSLAACDLGPLPEVDADVSKQFWSVAFAVAWRVLHNVFTTPSCSCPG